MQSHRKLFLGGVILLLLAAWPTLGQDPPEPPLPPEGDDLDILDDMEALDDLDVLADQPQVREQLGLTEAQIEQLRALGRTAAKNSIRNRADWAVKRMELEELLEPDKPDRVLIDKKLKEIADLQYGMLRARVDTRLVLAGVFTPEQRRKLRQFARMRMRARMRDRRRGFGQRFPMREPGAGPRGFGPGFRPRQPGEPQPPPPPKPPTL